MEIELKKIVTVNVAFIEVGANPRYWEDATVNGEEDKDGKIPFRKVDSWEPVIDLHTGMVKDWPAGVTADVHYKVCDAGEYWLQDENGERVAKWAGDYVPDNILCIGDTGYGDYIILKIGADGLIEGWCAPSIHTDKWEAL